MKPGFDHLPWILGVVFTVLPVLAIALLAFLRVNRRFTPTPHEVGHTPTYSLRMGVSLGNALFSSPFVRVTAYDDFVVIAPVFFGLHVLRPSDSVRVERTLERPAIFLFGQTQVVVHHAQSDVPSPIVMLVRDPTTLESSLRASLQPRPS